MGAPTMRGYIRVSHRDVDRAITRYLHRAIDPVPARALIRHIQMRFEVPRYKASNAVTYSLRRLRLWGYVAMTGDRKGARYSLVEQEAVANG